MEGLKKARPYFGREQAAISWKEQEVPLDTRFWDLDFLRGSAVVSMIAFYTAFNLNYFGSYKINAHSGPWLLWLGLYPKGLYTP
jgi:uncharacterized membrane protein